MMMDICNVHDNDQKIFERCMMENIQGRDKLVNGDKHARAGPGTGSMGGKCSVCGDRATKVSPLETIRPFLKCLC